MQAILLAVVLGAALGALPEQDAADPARSAHVPREAQPAGQWEIVFDDETTYEEYARQLDFFKIEIGAVSKSGRIEYIAKVSQPRPEKRVGKQETDYRWRIAWQKGNLHVADRKLLAKAGIRSGDKELLHFFPVEVQARMAALERDYKKREAKDIRRTRFQIVEDKGGAYKLVVVEQDAVERSMADGAKPSTADVKSPSTVGENGAR
jgi:hypothetical protein